MKSFTWFRNVMRRKQYTRRLLHRKHSQYTRQDHTCGQYYFWNCPGVKLLPKAFIHTKNIIYWIVVKIIIDPVIGNILLPSLQGTNVKMTSYPVNCERIFHAMKTFLHLITFYSRLKTFSVYRVITSMDPRSDRDVIRKVPCREGCHIIPLVWKTFLHDSEDKTFFTCLHLIKFDQIW